jgi:hypothetical protein
MKRQLAMLKSDRATIERLKVIAGNQSLAGLLRDIAAGKSTVTIPAAPVEARLANIEALLRTMSQNYLQLAVDAMECPEIAKARQGEAWRGVSAAPKDIDVRELPGMPKSKREGDGRGK